MAQPPCGTAYSASYYCKNGKEINRIAHKERLNPVEFRWRHMHMMPRQIGMVTNVPTPPVSIPKIGLYILVCSSSGHFNSAHEQVRSSHALVAEAALFVPYPKRNQLSLNRGQEYVYTELH